jgi:hypothetical protein
MVLPNSTLRKGGAANDQGRGVSVTNYNDFRGADPTAVAAISSRIDQMEQICRAGSSRRCRTRAALRVEVRR